MVLFSRGDSREICARIRCKEKASCALQRCCRAMIYASLTRALVINLCGGPVFGLNRTGRKQPFLFKAGVAEVIFFSVWRLIFLRCEASLLGSFSRTFVETGHRDFHGGLFCLKI